MPAARHNLGHIAPKVQTIVNINDLIEINSWSKVSKKNIYIYIHNSTRTRLNEEVVIK